MQVVLVERTTYRQAVMVAGQKMVCVKVSILKEDRSLQQDPSHNKDIYICMYVYISLLCRVVQMDPI